MFTALFYPSRSLVATPIAQSPVSVANVSASKLAVSKAISPAAVAAAALTPRSSFLSFLPPLSTGSTAGLNAKKPEYRGWGNTNTLIIDEEKEKAPTKRLLELNKKSIEEDFKGKRSQAADG